LHLPKDRYFVDAKHVGQGDGLGNVRTGLANDVIVVAVVAAGERTLWEVQERCANDSLTAEKNWGG